MSMPFPLKTSRLIIRELKDADAAAVYRYRGDPRVSMYQAWTPLSEHDVLDFIRRDRSQLGLTPDSWYQVAITQDETVVGDIGIHILSDERQAELGITLKATAQRKGIATEALTAILDLLFVRAGKHRVTASVDPRNTRSIALWFRLGFRLEGQFVQSIFVRDEWVDDLAFAMLADDWRRRGG